MNNTRLSHQEFVSLWQEGMLNIDVHRSKALMLAGSRILPMRYRFAHIFWSWVWILTIPAALLVMYFYKLWLGLLLLFTITPIISSAVKTSAMEFMIDHSIEDHDFYEYAIHNGILRVWLK